MNFEETIKVGMLNRPHVRRELKYAINEHKSFQQNLIHSKISFTEKWGPFKSTFVISGIGFNNNVIEHVKEWMKEISYNDYD